MEITTKQIANICGVSRGTVDRALNDRSGINKQTKEKILHVSKELGYRPHHLARSLVKGKTFTIGVVVFDLYNRFFAQLVNSIEDAAKNAGYFISLSITDKDKERERACIEQLVSRKTDGIILISVNKGNEFEQYLRSLNTSLVTVGNRISKNWPFVGINDRKAIKDAVKYLVKKGYTKIIYISPPVSQKGKKNIYAMEERFLGYKEAFYDNKLNGVPVVVKTKNYKDILKKIDHKEFGRTALLFSSDIYALEALNYLKSEDVRVPEELGVMGFDNIDILQYVTPSLATVAYHIEEIGREAVNCLINQIECNSYSKDTILDHTIIEGESV